MAHSVLQCNHRQNVLLAVIAVTNNNLRYNKNKKPSCCWDGQLMAHINLIDFHFRDLEMTLKAQPRSKVKVYFY